MRRVAAALTLALLLASLFVCRVFASVWREGLPAGEVLYHQSFADVKDYESSGFVTGTDTPDTTSVAVKDGALALRDVSGGRGYVIMPEISHGKDLTAEFTFRFTESGLENGRLDFMVNCLRDEPTNIISVVIRGDGSVDDFSVPTAEVASAIRGGKQVTAEILVENGAMYRMRLTSGKDSCTLVRNEVKAIPLQDMGFSVRNSGVAITDVWVMNGTDYTAKTGDTASRVKNNTGPTETETEKEIPKETSPKTGDRSKDRMRIYEQVAVMSGGVAFVLSCGFLRRKKT